MILINHIFYIFSHLPSHYFSIKSWTRPPSVHEADSSRIWAITAQTTTKKSATVLHNNLSPWQNSCLGGFCPEAVISLVSALLLSSTLLHFLDPAFTTLVLILIIPNCGLLGSKGSIIRRWSLRQLNAQEEWLLLLAERAREGRGECVSGLVFPYHLG